MKLDDLDRLIADLAEESVACWADEHARSLMADASAVLGRYRLQCNPSNSIALVLDQAQVISEGLRMRQAKQEMPEPRPTPEDLAQSTIARWDASRVEKNSLSLDLCLAQAIRKDREFRHD